MGGAAAVVDVDPVGIGVDHVGVQIGEAVEQPGRRGGGGAVGAVHQDVQSRQVGADGGHQVVDVVLALLLVGVDHPADVPAGFQGYRHIVEDDVLDAVLQLVGQLEAPAVEDLDAVVLKGVVGRGDHHPRIAAGVHRHPGHRRGGDHAQVEHVGPGGAQPGDQRPLQQIGGDAGVLADGKPGLPAPLLLGHHVGGGHAHLVRQRRVQSVVDDTADAVGSK